MEDKVMKRKMMREGRRACDEENEMPWEMEM